MATLPRILVIDDQWGQPDDPMIPDRYGALPYEWLLESARGDAGQFTADQALDRVRREVSALDAILLDVSFGRSSDRLGVRILEAIRAEFPILPVLMFTSLDSARNRELVVRCMELGANEFVEKAPSPKAMDAILQAYTSPQSDWALYGNSALMRGLRARIARVAFSGETSVLIVGESGTGKELVARALHRQGPKRNGAFVAKNCAHGDSQLLDSELFGHERGAFTGAEARRIGLIEEANGGTLFLDEVADTPTALQAKLLRALETRTFRRLGGNTDIGSTFQLICATNKRPEELIAAGSLREDFFYRIAAVTLYVAPLRERIEDVATLADLFLKRFKVRGGASYVGECLSRPFLKRLQTSSWPGNVRELRNVVERAVILSTEKVIGPEVLAEQLPLRQPGSRPSSPEQGREVDLPEDTTEWPYMRVIAELKVALEAKERVQKYKGTHWKAEFMRLMYPECKAANAKGFDDLVNRLTKGPWGCSTWKSHQLLSELLSRLRS